jgi:hypothetical protein
LIIYCIFFLKKRHALVDMLLQHKAATAFTVDKNTCMEATQMNARKIIMTLLGAAALSFVATGGYAQSPPLTPIKCKSGAFTVDAGWPSHSVICNGTPHSIHAAPVVKQDAILAVALTAIVEGHPIILHKHEKSGKIVGITLDIASEEEEEEK